MELIFLGTSSGTPTKDRNVSACGVRLKNSKSWCLVDCGEATQHQILHSDLSINQLQAIFITHVHGDHCYGLPGLLASAGMNGRRHKLKIIGPKNIELMLQAIMQYSEMYLAYELEFYDVEDLNYQQLDKDLDFHCEIIKLSHRVPSYAYGFRAKSQSHKLDIAKLKKQQIPSTPFWGQLQKGLDVVLENGKQIKSSEYLIRADRAKKIIIAGDNDSPELLMKSAKSADVLVHESTYTKEMSDKIGLAPQHCSAEIIAQMAEKVGIQNLVLTHFSARYQLNSGKSPSITDIEEEAKQHYSGHLLLANDLDLMYLDKDRFLIVKHKQEQ
jgi:ribonuclease Z